MSSLGQLSARLDRRLQLVGDLSKAMLALRANLMDKLAAFKLTPDDVNRARTTIIVFLEGLVPVLNSAERGSEEHRVVRENLTEAGEQPSDWAEDFGKMIEQLRANAPIESSQLDKIMRIVGYLQGVLAEDVRRLRSR